MEAALTWLFGHVHHRVPTGRAPSFSTPFLPLTPAAAGRSPPPGVLACPLPVHSKTDRRLSARPPAAVGWQVDDWALHSAKYVLNARGQRLFVQTWRPIVKHQSTSFWSWLRGRRPRRTHAAKGIVHLVHGLNDHSNKYTRVARAWVEAGYVVCAHDFHGHGRSDGFRAYTSSIQNYVDDARLAVQSAEMALPSPMTNLPRFLLAHSLGGAVAIHLAREWGQWSGVMLTAPAVKVFPKPLLKLFAPVLGNFLPLLPVQKLKFDKRRRAKGGDYVPAEDPLVVRSPVRARVGYEVLKSCDKIMSEAERFKVPVFVAHSREDRVTNAKGTVDFHERIGSLDKTVRLYDGRVHDLLAEKRDMVMADMVAWAEDRLR
eukprot:GFKZ01015611.1.p1 GENE.GFKZ01015611.1~~GFKZ01015611.1.p1  ORF type:complete len:373 (-),score=40.03 GFKZ01015611.1:371-1489(-)